MRPLNIPVTKFWREIFKYELIFKDFSSALTEKRNRTSLQFMNGFQHPPFPHSNSILDGIQTLKRQFSCPMNFKTIPRLPKIKVNYPKLNESCKTSLKPILNWRPLPRRTWNLDLNEKISVAKFLLILQAFICEEENDFIPKTKIFCLPSSQKQIIKYLNWHCGFVDSCKFQIARKNTLNRLH